MGKEVLAMDVDEVLFPLLEHFLMSHNVQQNTQFSFDDFKTYHFEDVLGLSVPETVDRVYAFSAADHSHIDPILSTQEGITRLKNRFDIEIVTARHEQFRPNTSKWLHDKIGQFFGDIHMIGYAPILEKPLTKAEICLLIGAVALVDDNPTHVFEMPEVGKEGILFGNYPWNRDVILPKGVTRCEDMIEVAEHFGV